MVVEAFEKQNVGIITFPGKREQIKKVLLFRTNVFFFHGGKSKSAAHKDRWQQRADLYFTCRYTKVNSTYIKNRDLGARNLRDIKKKVRIEKMKKK